MRVSTGAARLLNLKHLQNQESSPYCRGLFVRGHPEAQSPAARQGCIDRLFSSGGPSSAHRPCFPFTEPGLVRCERVSGGYGKWNELRRGLCAALAVTDDCSI